VDIHATASRSHAKQSEARFCTRRRQPERANPTITDANIAKGNILETRWSFSCHAKPWDSNFVCKKMLFLDSCARPLLRDPLRSDPKGRRSQLSLKRTKLRLPHTEKLRQVEATIIEDFRRHGEKPLPTRMIGVRTSAIFVAWDAQIPVLRGHPRKYRQRAEMRPTGSEQK